MAHFGWGALSACAAMALLNGCAAAPPAEPVAAVQSILYSSTPADRSTVAGPVTEIALRFSPPARLDEMTVTGSDGMTMPMMVTAAGEVSSYSIPVSDLETGAYTVQWRASAGGTPHQGTIRFTVR
jgi:methionine-rich copper-binding protein CopC